MCFSKPRKPLKSKRSAINRIGPVAAKWMETKNEWFQKNPAAVYICNYCGKEMTKEETTLDHKLSRSRRPDLRFDLDNLVPCCWNDNYKKGSLSSEEYLEKLNVQKI